MYVTFTYITQIVHLNEHSNPLKAVFSDKPLITAVILKFQFCGNFRLTRNVAAEGFELFSCLSLKTIVLVIAVTL